MWNLGPRYLFAWKADRVAVFLDHKSAQCSLELLCLSLEERVGCGPPLVSTRLSLLVVCSEASQNIDLICDPV